MLAAVCLLACARNGDSTHPREGEESGREYRAHIEFGAQKGRPGDLDASSDRSEVNGPEGAARLLAEGRRVVFFAPLRCRQAEAAGEVTMAVEHERARCAALMVAAESVGKAAGLAVADGSLLAHTSDPVGAAREQGIDVLFALSPSSGAGPQPGSVIASVVTYQRDAGTAGGRIEVSEGTKQRCRHIASVVLNNDPTLYAQMLRLSMTAIDVQSGAAFWEYSSSVYEPESPELHGAWFELSTRVERREFEVPPDPELIQAADRRDAARMGVGAVSGVALALLFGDVTWVGMTIPHAREGDEARRSSFIQGNFPSPEAAMCNVDATVRTNLQQLLRTPPSSSDIESALLERHASLIAQEARDFSVEVRRIRDLAEDQGDFAR